MDIHTVAQRDKSCSAAFSLHASLCRSQVRTMLAGAGSKGSNSKAGGASMRMVVRAQAKGRKLSAVCEEVPVLISACASSPAQHEA